MSMVTYPLNNIEYTAEDAELFHSTRTSGVYATDSFDYSVTGSDNSIVIGTGIAWIKNRQFSGKVVAQKEPMSLDMGLPDPTYPRIDAVVIQFNSNKNATEIVVKNGAASSFPIAPEVVRTESLYELHLYHVRREAGSLSISAPNITDLRNNNAYCGLMSDSITQAVDSTLSKNGVAADAAATGAAIQEVSQNKISKSGDDVSGWLNFTGTTQGIKWKTADGTEFQIRPYTIGNVFQIVTKTTDEKTVASFGVKNDGTVRVGKPDEFRTQIGALEEKWGFASAAANGVLTDALVVSTSAADGQYNVPKLVTKGTTTKNMPSDCEMGVRTVHFHSTSCILVRIDGIATDGTAGVWYNIYNGSGWNVWKRIDMVLESTTAPGCYYRYCNSVIEWMNPPMVLGTEYKTVERWQGKAVYTKLVFGGLIPANGQKTFAHNASATHIIRCIASADDGASLPYFYYPTSIDVMATKTEVQIFAQNRTAEVGNVYAQIWYTKD